MEIKVKGFVISHGEGERPPHPPSAPHQEAAHISAQKSNSVKLLLNYFSCDDLLRLARKIIAILWVLGTAAVHTFPSPFQHHSL